MKPFLILQLRDNQEAADGEYRAILKFGGLNEEETIRVRMEKDSLPEIKLDDFSGVIVGGGPTKVSDPKEKQSEAQLRYEAEINNLLDEIVETDFPYLGACSGLSFLAVNLNGLVSKEKYAEVPGGTTIVLTEEGRQDGLTKDLLPEFRALCGHQEACQMVPDGAVLLATSKTCLVQMIRVKNNVYGVQFHPELDVLGIIVRINVYKNAGYFPSADAGKLIEECKNETITEPQKILKNFVDKYRSQN